jgi:pimeloyl-ACP methyl ester carboxylesterase
MGEVRAGIDATLGVKPTVGVFHSISAVTAICDTLDNGVRWDALVLFDPPLVPTPGDEYHQIANQFDIEMSNWAATRADRFADSTELSAAFKNSYRLRRWVDGAHDLMARSILRRDETAGEWVLCCPRDGESRIYKTTDGLDLCSRLGGLGGRVMFVCPDPDQDDAQAPSKVIREMHARFGCRYEMVPNTSHLLQVENPTACARIARDFLAECGVEPARPA